MLPRSTGNTRRTFLKQALCTYTGLICADTLANSTALNSFGKYLAVAKNEEIIVSAAFPGLTIALSDLPWNSA